MRKGSLDSVLTRTKDLKPGAKTKLIASVSSATCSTVLAKKGRGEQAGRSTRKTEGSRVKKADGPTAVSNAETSLRIVTR